MALGLSTVYYRRTDLKFWSVMKYTSVASGIDLSSSMPTVNCTPIVLFM
jgi:hypothetical protein